MVGCTELPQSRPPPPRVFGKFATAATSRTIGNWKQPGGSRTSDPPQVPWHGGRAAAGRFSDLRTRDIARASGGGAGCDGCCACQCRLLTPNACRSNVIAGAARLSGVSCFTGRSTPAARSPDNNRFPWRSLRLSCGAVRALQRRRGSTARRKLLTQLPVGSRHLQANLQPSDVNSKRRHKRGSMQRRGH